MLKVNPADRPDIKELLTGLEAIAIAMDVDLKGRVVSFQVSLCFVYFLGQCISYASEELWMHLGIC